ncbi:MAG: acylphosphatase, partial [Rubrobacter sp.]
MRAPIQERRGISVRGIVQGVGFRPFVYALARQHGLTGLVRNDAEGVHIEVEGDSGSLDLFLRGIEEDAPPLAVVEAVAWQPLAALGERDFRIEESREGVRRRTLVSPDVATCEDCLREVFVPSDRRYRYPFTNCTNCGPRFTITRSVPYDRATTTMSAFEMCPECQAEYDDPSERRFHAQPNACPVCGPRVRLLDRFGHELRVEPGDPISRT